jgi:16S rRNA (guanine527-N7)-methyltransferase
MIASSLMEPAAPDDFCEALDELGINIADHDIERCAAYLAILLETNKRFNLTSIRDPDEAWTRHILDSLTLLPLLETYPWPLADSESGPELADVGSGGGLPGIPLAIGLPSVHFTLIESTGKKATFLNQCVEELGLVNVRVVNDRAESLAKVGGPGRERFDGVVARAVGPMNVLLEFTIPFLKPMGVAFFIKGQKAETELEQASNACKVLRCAHLETIPTPTGRIVIVEKELPTPKQFPRTPGEPKKNPL